MAYITKKVSKIDGKKTYYVVYRLGGKLVWKRVGKDMGIARRIKVQIENEIMLGNLPTLSHKPVPFSTFVDEKYLPYKDSPLFSKNTYEICLHSCKPLKEHFGDTSLSSITPEMIHAFISKRSKQVAPRTVNLSLIYLNQLLSKAIEWGYLTRSPYKYGKIQKLKEPRKTRYLTNEEIMRIMNCGTQWVKSFVLLTVNLGLRAGELTNLKWSDVNFDKREVKIQATHSKNRRERLIPLTATAYKILCHLKDNLIEYESNQEHPREPHQRVYVFCDRDGCRIQCFRRSFDRAVQKAGLQGVTLHTLRHTFASHLVMNGASILEVKELLGHSDIKTTTIYAHLSNEHLHKAISKIDFGGQYRNKIETLSKKQKEENRISVFPLTTPKIKCALLGSNQ